MKILYFNSGSGSPSETFIRDLIGSLSSGGISVCTVSASRTDKASRQLEFERRSVLDRGLSLLSRLSAGRLVYVDRYAGARALAAGFQSLVQAEQPDVAFIDYATTAVMLAPHLEAHRIAFVVHVHGYDVTAAIGNPFFRQKLDRLFGQAAKIISPSHHLRRRLVLLGCPPEKIEVVHYEPQTEGVGVKPLDSRTPFPSVVALGRLTPKKDPIALIRAFALVRQSLETARLAVIGDGPLRGGLESEIRNLGLENSVELTGAMPRGEALKLVSKSWVFAQHSVTAPNGDQEGFPVAILEASALALPVVSTRHSGIPEQVIDGETGFLVAEHDYGAMAAKMLELLQDPAKCAAMGQRAQQHIQQLCPLGQRVKTVIHCLRQASP